MKKLDIDWSNKPSVEDVKPVIVVNGGLEMPNYGGIEVLKPINTCLFFS